MDDIKIRKAAARKEVEEDIRDALRTKPKLKEAVEDEYPRLHKLIHTQLPRLPLSLRDDLLQEVTMILLQIPPQRYARLIATGKFSEYARGVVYKCVNCEHSRFRSTYYRRRECTLNEETTSDV